MRARLPGVLSEEGLRLCHLGGDLRLTDKPRRLRRRQARFGGSCWSETVSVWASEGAWGVSEGVLCFSGCLLGGAAPLWRQAHARRESIGIPYLEAAQPRCAWPPPPDDSRRRREAKTHRMMTQKRHRHADSRDCSRWRFRRTSCVADGCSPSAAAAPERIRWTTPRTWHFPCPPRQSAAGSDG